MKTEDFNYSLPQGLIAQTPVEPRDQSRLMVLNRRDGSVEHRKFFEVVDFLRDGDVLVFNNSRVIPARLSGRKSVTGGRLELLLLHRLAPKVWETLIRPSKRVKAGSVLELIDSSITSNGEGSNVLAEVVELMEGGRGVVSFSDETPLPKLGQIPLPPYIRVPLKNPERYQTVYANKSGSVAAPTAGLHFTPELINKVSSIGVHCLFVTLHVGLDTFQPVREDNPIDHTIHQEYGILSQEVADQLSKARAEGKRIICIGTTTVRLLETAARTSNPAQIQPFEGWTNLFILPGYKFQIVNTLITNFHLPKSTLLMLVTAFTGREMITKAYQEAIAREYRFYSFGDAMLIL